MSHADTVALKSLTSLVGPSGSPVKRAKGKLERKEILRQLAAIENPEIGIRAALSVGKSTAPQFLTSENLVRALSPDDLIRNLDKLTDRKSFIDATAALAAFQKSSNNLTPKDAWKTAVQIERGVKRWKTSNLAAETAAALVSIAKTLVSTLRGQDKITKNRKPFWDLFGFIQQATLPYPQVSGNVLDLIANSVDVFGAEFEHLLEENKEIHAGFVALLSNFHALLREHCIRGDTLALQTTARGPLRNRVLCPLVRAEIDKLWNEREKFTIEIQKTIASLTGRENERNPLDDSSAGPQSVAVLQLSSILLASWEAAQKNPENQPLFHQVQATLRDHFGLEIFGTVDSRVEFNARLYEAVSAGRSNENPILIRPGVKTEGGTATEVLIKALVEWEEK